MTELEILAQLKMSYYYLDDIIENSDETQIKSVEDLEQILRILEAKYEEVYQKIKNNNDISLYYEEDLLISRVIYNDYETNSKDYDDQFLSYKELENEDKWWEDYDFLTKF